MTVQPHQAPRCAADSSANCVSPGSGMRLQPLAPAGAAPGSICFLLVVHRHRGWMEGPPSIGGGEGPGQKAQDGVQQGDRVPKNHRSKRRRTWKNQYRHAMVGGNQVSPSRSSQERQRKVAKPVLPSPCLKPRGEFCQPDLIQRPSPKDKSLWDASCTRSCNCVDII